MKSVESRLMGGETNLDGHADLAFVLRTAAMVKDTMHATQTDEAGAIVDTLLLRNILAGQSIVQILEISGNTDQSADFSSVAILARSIMEGYCSISYFCGWNCGAAEKETQMLWWDWHDVNERLRTLSLIESKADGIARLHERKRRLKTALCSRNLPDQIKRSLDAVKKPRTALLKSNRQIAKEAGILPSHFEIHYQQLSAIAHSQPTIISAMIKHDAEAPAIRRMLKEGIQIATAYLAFSVRDYSNLICPSQQLVGLRFLKIACFWAELFQTPFSSAK